MAAASIPLDAETRARRLQALGYLATTMAHELNNLNMVVTGNLELIQQQPADPGNAPLIDKCRDAAWRGADILRGLLELVGSPIQGSLPLAELLRHVELLLSGRFAKEGVDLHLTAPPALATTADGSVVAQVLVAELLDACTQAAGSRGRAVSLVCRRHDERIVVELHGSGGGFAATGDSYEQAASPRELLRRLDNDERRALLQSVGGELERERQAGDGSTVRLYLPLEGGAETAGAQLPRVLVLDDELIMGELVTELLRDQATVVTAGDLAGARPLAGEVDLIFADLHLPDASDQAVIDGLREIAPHTPIVVMSGTVIVGEDPAQRGWHGVAGCLPKPFSASELSATLRRHTSTGA